MFKTISKIVAAATLVAGSFGIGAGVAHAQLSGCNSDWILTNGVTKSARSICYSGVSGAQRIVVWCGGTNYVRGPWVGAGQLSTSGLCPSIAISKSIQFSS